MFLFFIVGSVRGGVTTKHVANLLALMPDGANPSLVELSYTSVVFSKSIDTCTVRPPILFYMRILSCLRPGLGSTDYNFTI